MSYPLDDRGGDFFRGNTTVRRHTPVHTEALRTTVITPRRSRTKEAVPVVPQQAQKQHSGISRRNMLLAGGGALALAGLGVLQVGAIKTTEIGHQFEEGIVPAVTKTLVCGHHDSVNNPTYVLACLTGPVVNLIEWPGGDAEKVSICHFPSLRDIGYIGDLALVYLQIFPIRLLGGKYKLILRVSCGDAPVLPMVPTFSKSDPVVTQWTLEDAGDRFVPKKQ